MTNEEHVLWRELRNALTGASFRRQCPLFGYVADFFSHECDLAIEVDGPVHRQRSADDARRDQRFGNAGIAVLRFTNDDIVNELPRVVDEIRGTVARRLERNGRPRREAKPAKPSPLRGGAGVGNGFPRRRAPAQPTQRDDVNEP
jgi:very-short-patch-repair endonuclease